jgi:pilus assembly protein Flp/PilA
MRQTLRRFLHDDSAATMVEYGVMVALIAAVAILAVTTLGTEVRDTFTSVGTQIGAAN